MDSEIGESAPVKRVIRAPRGTKLNTKGWQQEAALRMLMNNLDPDVAEKPGRVDRLRWKWESCKKLGSVRCYRENSEAAEER